MIEKTSNDKIDTGFLEEIERQETKRPRIGWVCTYTPEELILASGAAPVRIINKDPVTNNKGYLPTNFCPFIKSVMQQVLQDNTLDGIVIANSCDGLRRLYDVIGYYKKDLKSFMLDVPRNINDISIENFAANLLKLKFFLQDITKNTIDASKLNKAIEINARKKRLLKQLGKLYIKDPSNVGFYSYARSIELSMVKEPSLFIESLEKGIKVIKKAEGTSNITGFTDIFLSGSFVIEKKLWDIFDDLSLRMVGDDICSAGRYLSNILDPVKDSKEGLIIRAIASSYLKKTRCMRMADMGQKLKNLLKSLDNSKARGLLYLSMKFCDNSLLFYPYLKEKLNDIGIPSLFIELENTNFPEGQIRTRLQAFKELVV